MSTPPVRPDLSPALAARFGDLADTLVGGQHPVIEQMFVPGRGWLRFEPRKPVIAPWVRALQAQGVTRVSVSCKGQLADFPITDLTP